VEEILSGRSARRTIQTSRDQFLSAQISKGLEDLGSYGDDKIMVRLGGIYALEGIMKISEDYWSQTTFGQQRIDNLDWLNDTSQEYQQPVLEALCAFVRDRTRGLTRDPQPTDIQAALTVIGRRPPGRGNVDLTKAAIPHASLAGANLQKADMREVDLTSADLIKADLTGADLSDSKLERVKLNNANLVDANLTKASLDFAALTNAKLTNANLTDADLTASDLHGADLAGANLTGTNLSRTDLTSVTGISQSQLDRACGIAMKLPVNWKIAECPKPIQ
jgi:uncharacterized protein YjbI with pentapeptide repeats